MRNRLAVVVTAAVGVAVMVTSVALADQTYKDPAGDGRSGPDVTSVSVRNDDEGTLTFTIAWPGIEPLAKHNEIALLIDTDRNKDTGADAGADVVIEFDGDPTDSYGGRWYFNRWDGTKLGAADASTGEATFEAGDIEMSINAKDLFGRPFDETMLDESFDFWVYSFHDAKGTVFAGDRAPGGRGVFTFQLEKTLAYDPALELKASIPIGTPSQPIAGKRFSAASFIWRTDTSRVRGAKVTCTVRAETKLVPARAGFSKQTAYCAMTVPKGSSGKRLCGTIKVTAGRLKVSERFVFRIG